MNWLLSYPRSGNTWLRYAIEYITQKPTIGYTVDDASWFDKKPLLFDQLDGDPILTKRHSLRGKFEQNDVIDPVNDKLIIIVRDYREAIIRHCALRRDTFNVNSLRQILTGSETANTYHEILEDFDNWPGKKTLILYEQITNVHGFTTSFSELLHFLGQTGAEITDRFSQFCHEFDSHKQKSIDLYGDSHSKGGHPKFHSSKLDQSQLAQLDELVKSLNPGLYEQYLKAYRQ